MTDSKLENRILYIILFILLSLILVMIFIMPISLLKIELDQESLNSFATFFGSLLGAFITGATAIGVMVYQANENKKEKYYRNYGSNKYVAVKLLNYPELMKITVSILNMLKNPPSPGLLGWEQNLISKIPVKQFSKILTTLREERDKIPYEFVARYYTLVNQLEYLIDSLEDLKQDYSNGKIESVLKQLELGEDISKRFRDNLLEFILQIEKRYDIKDYY
ncbi:hypothetical protein [Sporosarcina sp. Marseille-Q4943]|uniref:hypothetical protein n=1 Tax=Sporosarcina sp. Marseille-Q4943 TaxID=2942204 RepID=UPI00208DAC0C|nr:hypothetical protein [Sporosarcina sp. Marseille-Q4943]